MPKGGHRIPISEIEFDEIGRRQKNIAGWEYPRRELSAYYGLLPRHEQIALAFYFWIAIGLFIAGIVLPFILVWSWVGLLILAVILWRANKESGEQFFIRNLQSNRAFYDAVRKSPLGSKVFVVFK